MKHIVFIFCFLFSQIGFGQSDELPKVMPPSPQSAEMIKYIDFPMDLTTGLPEVSIPLYTIKSGDLELPISLSYHGDGLKPNEAESGLIGLGWTLNTGGIIARSSYGLPDERFWNMKVANEDTIQSVPFTMLKNKETGSWQTIPDEGMWMYGLARKIDADMEPDIFSYIFPGGSGKFIFDKNTILSNFLKPILLPHKPLKITPTFVDASPNYFSSFNILDENGTKYLYGKSYETGELVNEEYYNTSSATVFEDCINTWPLTAIISADNSKVINIEYENVIRNESYGGERLWKGNISFSETRTFVNDVSGSTYWESSPSINYSGYEYTLKRVKEINFQFGYVKFIYGSNVYPDYQLDKIEVYSNNNANPLRTIEFLRSKYHNYSNWMNWYKLDHIVFKDSDGLEISRYSFTYETGVFPTIKNTTNSGLNFSYAIDYLGYYNGKNNNQNTLTGEWQWIVGGVNCFGAADRSPNWEMAKIGMLKEIIYPTGGIRTFNYEGNYTSNYVPGIRLATNTLTETGGSILKRKYTYDGGGIVKRRSFEYYKSEALWSGTSSLHHSYTASSEPNVSLLYDSKPIFYSDVTEHLVNENNESIGSISHRFESHLPYLVTTPQRDVWTIPRGYPWTNEVSTEAYYYIILNVDSAEWDLTMEGLPAIGRYTFQPLERYYSNLGFAEPSEVETIVLDALGNRVKKTTNTYNNLLVNSFKGFKSDVAVSYAPGALRNKNYFYYFHNYTIDQYKKTLGSTEVIDYLNGDSVTTLREFAYNNDLQVIETKIKNSDGTWDKSIFRYPKDINLDTSEDPGVRYLYGDMVAKNMISPIIEELNFKAESELVSGKLMQSIRTDYGTWGTDIFKPATVKVANGEDPYETRLEYISYDSDGNLLSVIKDSGPVYSYLWGYDNTLPIAQVVNANSNEVAYTGFENGNFEGGWSGINYYYTGDSRTGKRCYDPAPPGGISKTGLPSGTYILGFWAKANGNGSPYAVINGSNHSIYGSANGWFYYETTFTGTTVSINPQNIYIDDLRLYPADAQMTSYTYTPLIGPTSVTGPDGKSIQKYEFDAYGRLYQVKDQDGNVLKEYTYNYSNE